ncbi:MAG: PQQ-dependent sugar dehydrogenase [Acidimicrobiales bacterium]|nr:PQQ-dependent sugar dehydrogenase [Acidimicrobiales bacterium]
MTLRSHRLAGRRGGAALMALTVLVVAAAAPCRPQPEITVTTVLSGLSRPWDIAFAPGGDMFFTERVGRINVRTDGQHRVLATPTDAVAIGEGGMMGIALDPEYGANRRVYTCFLSNASGALDVRIARWRVNGARTALTHRTDILTGIPAHPTGRHSGCRIRFGPDGMLWVGTGDAAVGTNPQDPTSLGGKVLRITTDGAGAPGNAGPPFRAEIYTYGHRNVQGVTFAADGTPYSVEHGPDRDDEVNLLVRAGNYGWDPVPGYDESVPMTDLAEFPDAREAVWSSGAPTIAPSGGVILSGEQWKGWDEALAMAVLKGRQLRVLGLTDEGTAVEQEWTTITDRGRLRVAVQGPDGDLYIATDASPGSILRVAPVPD